MLSKGDTLAVGVSGGADSVCLLFALHELQSLYDLRLLVVHVNHGIRPEAKGDSEYVKSLCEKWQLPFFLFEEDVVLLANQRGQSTEEAGRELRYECFERVLKEQAPEALQKGQAKIAVAHNSNDRAETMLFNLFRGSGLTGLGSIKPVRDQVIRPLLCLQRKEIEELLAKEGISHCEDSTNKEDIYSRNKIRNHVLPYVEQEISAGAIEHISAAASLVAESQDFIRQTVEELFDKYVVKEADGSLSVFGVDVIDMHPFLRKELILRMFEYLVPYRKDLGAIHVEQVEDLLVNAGNREVHLPYQMVACRRYEVISLFRRTESEFESKKGERTAQTQYVIETEFPMTIEIEDLGRLEFQLFPYEKSQDIPQNQCTKWFDYDKIKNYITVRNRLTGDYLTINKELSKKSLQDYMVDEKIPREKRDKVWLLADADHIVWVIGYRISQEYKVNENTKQILQVQLIGGR